MCILFRYDSHKFPLIGFKAIKFEVCALQIFFFSVKAPMNDFVKQAKLFDAKLK